MYAYTSGTFQSVYWIGSVTFRDKKGSEKMRSFELATFILGKSVANASIGICYPQVNWPDSLSPHHGTGANGVRRPSANHIKTYF